MKKIFCLLLLTVVLLITFNSCKKNNVVANTAALSDTTAWTFNGVTDTATSLDQIYNSLSVSNFAGDQVNIEFGSLPYGNQTYTVIASNGMESAMQCGLTVVTGSNNLTYFSTGANGNKVTLTTIGNKEIFSFSNITVTADFVNYKTVSGTIVED